jgi:hypothetical protein
MATIDDINAAKNDAVKVLDQQIMDGIAKKNAGVPNAQATKLDNDIHFLMLRRSAVFSQAYTAGLATPEMDAALNNLRAATADMNTVAAKMGSVTTFIDNAADLGAAADKAIVALKGP